MTFKLPNGTVVIAAQPDQKCCRCKRVRECRDVLGDGKPMCFDCASPSEKEAYGKRLFGA